MEKYNNKKKQDNRKWRVLQNKKEKKQLRQRINAVIRTQKTKGIAESKD